MKKIKIFILALVFIISSFSFNISAKTNESTPFVLDFSLTGSAEPSIEHITTDTRASGLILSYGLNLKKSGNTLQIYGTTDCSLDVIKCGFKDLMIQRRATSSDSWRDYYEFGNVYIEDITANLATTLSVASGYQYRITCKHYAKKNILTVQTVSNTSNIVTVS